MWLLLSGCVLPVSEVYRAQEPVFVEVPGEVSVRACTWSKWDATVAGCANLTDGELDESSKAYTVKEFSNPVTVILGEAPLMQTLYVACVDKAPRASAFFAWDAEMPIKVQLVDGKRDSFGDHAIDPADRERLEKGLCDGTVVQLKKP